MSSHRLDLDGWSMDILKNAALVNGWEVAKFLVSSIGLLLIGLSALIAVLRLNSLIELFTKVNDSRSTVFSLHGSIQKIENQVPQIEALVRQVQEGSQELQRLLKELGEMRIGEKLEEATRSVRETSEAATTLAERFNAFERETQRTEVELRAAASHEDGAATGEERTSWEQFSDIWNEATARLEKHISNEPTLSVRQQNKFNSISRRNYTDVIQAAMNNQVVSVETGIALLEIDDLFKSWRSRSSKLPSDVVDRARDLLSVVDQELPDL